MKTEKQKRDNQGRELLSQITGKSINITFGAPLSDAFSNAFPNASNEANEVVGIICMLYLSHFIAGFPLPALRAFITNIKEEVSLFSFNCKLYEKIYSEIAPESLNAVLLIDEDYEEKIFALTKHDIFEAFDFYTNQ